MEIFKTAKVTFDFMVTMATACIRELRNAHQKIPHKILGKVVKFWFKILTVQKLFEKILGGAESSPQAR